ncbi:MAG TPA: hypothetical protein VNT81_02410 [Vicinamibacterales bacterium]|nr:hypothetical protein [Vicinamibacterales bacterium]
MTVAIQTWRDRMKRLSPQAGADSDAAWWRTLDASLIGRGASAATAAFRRADAESQLAQALRSVAAQPPVARMRFVGVMTLVAAFVHVALMWPNRPIGFWWLIVPAIALTFGLLVTSVAMKADRG